MMGPDRQQMFRLDHCGELKPDGTLMFVWPAGGYLVLSCHPCTERMLAQMPRSVDPHHAQPLPTYVVSVTMEVRCGGQVSQVNPLAN